MSAPQIKAINSTTSSLYLCANAAACDLSDSSLAFCNSRSRRWIFASLLLTSVSSVSSIKCVWGVSVIRRLWCLWEVIEECSILLSTRY